MRVVDLMLEEVDLTPLTRDSGSIGSWWVPVARPDDGPMAWGTVAGLVAVAAVVALGDRSPEVSLPEQAVVQMSRAIGTDAPDSRIWASGDQVTLLARQASTDERVVRQVADNLDDQSWWPRTVREVSGLRSDVPPELRRTLVATACQALRGQITSEAELVVAVAESVPNDRPQRLLAATADVRGLWQLMYDAWNRGGERDRAAVALACFTVRELG